MKNANLEKARDLLRQAMELVDQACNDYGAGAADGDGDESAPMSAPGGGDTGGGMDAAKSMSMRMSKYKGM